ncbi:ATP-dependent nuclease [Paraburkholderia bryophila]|uniref:AAA domain-containing protein n=1 Tax=Paraburkholderia bryophila TaxID=420952 RepID=A0A329CWN3_9BURK|nr:AAA family ATPase [Paraburkholderia bryophila]RAS38342.1 AAA domain-containing protein [Paraburkholderia bryophila]
MDFLAFRIRNFRSIVDSEWQRFSEDRVTVLIGQNESGKSAVLDALALTVGSARLNENDCRVDSKEPEIHLRVRVVYEELESELASWGFFQKQAVRRYLSTRGGEVLLDYAWDRSRAEGRTVFEGLVGIADPELDKMLEDAHNTGTGLVNLGQSLTTIASAIANASTEGAKPVSHESPTSKMGANDLALVIHSFAPRALSFDVDSQALPDYVDIDDKGELVGAGRDAARNYLRAAKISLPELLTAERRTQIALTEKGDKKLNERFREFFEVGESSLPIPRLRCRLEYRPEMDATGTNRYLSFWVADGEADFYPAQRSRGVKWFVSLFLFLSASEKIRRGRLLLLDEPGAWLHIRAQQNLLRLLNAVKGDVWVVYTTHSPQLIEYEKLYRVRAVQRMTGRPGGPTTVIDAAHLGSATSDTLSPLYAAIGSDLSQQQHIQKTNNVLLEEISGFYYMNGFWQLTDCAQPAHFLAATGADKLVQLSFLLRGWGLEFIFAVDDDKKGRSLREKLKQTLYSGEEELTTENVILLNDCPGIEDVFSQTDFAAHVLHREPAPAGVRNSDYVKQLRASKPILASQFLQSVKKRKLTWDVFDDESKGRIKEAVWSISSALENKQRIG